MAFGGSVASTVLSRRVDNWAVTEHFNCAGAPNKWVVHLILII